MANGDPLPPLRGAAKESMVIGRNTILPEHGTNEAERN
jgi:hypothetical protein